MQACSNCGASVRDTARFCTACGTQLNEASSGNSAFSWGAAVEQSTTPDSPISSATSAPEIDETDSSETNEFAWSWDAPSSTDNEVSPDASELQPEAAVEASNMTSPDETVPTEPQDTLASWAQDWSTEDEVDEVGEEGVTPVAAVAAAADDDDDTDDAEATLEKAERLIAQLQSMIPRLAHPKPAKPRPVVPTHLADELDSLNDGSDWSDLRSVLEQARDNPHDINHLMTVSGNANRLLSLLDSRENIARTASDMATRLRNPEPDETNDEG